MGILICPFWCHFESMRKNIFAEHSQNIPDEPLLFSKKQTKRGPWILSYSLIIHYDCLRTSSRLTGGWNSDIIRNTIIIKIICFCRQFTRSEWTAAHDTQQMIAQSRQALQSLIGLPVSQEKHWAPLCVLQALWRGFGWSDQWQWGGDGICLP